MSINNIKYIKRIVSLSDLEVSAFLFGPRMTGKTTLLNSIESDLLLDLLDPELELEYRNNPQKFWNELEVLSDYSKIIIDEIQKIPELLNYVQMGIDRKNLIFILSGSSARKLKRGAANLLGGRALDYKIFPLTHKELKNKFSIEDALCHGTLPQIATLVLENKSKLAKQLLRSYVTTYIKEEIQAESLVRNLGSFQRFLNVAAQMNGQMIEFSNISRECSVPSSTVKGFYEILEDTLIGRFLWPLDSSERRKARPRFYFFDCGVVRSLQKRLNDLPTSSELGFLFETWFVNELHALDSYFQTDYEFNLWRKNHNEVDLVVTQGNKITHSFEIKSSENFGNLSGLKAFKKDFPTVQSSIVSLKAKRERIYQGFKVLPWKNAIRLLFS